MTNPNNQSGAAPATGNTEKEQEMYAAGLEMGEANAKNNAAIRMAAAPGDAPGYGLWCHTKADPQERHRPWAARQSRLAQGGAPVADERALHIKALQDLRLGVEMDQHCMEDGDAKLAALDAAITALRWSAGALQALNIEADKITLDGETRTVGDILDHADRALASAPVASARAALAQLEAACDTLCRLRTQEQYLSMVDSGQQDALLALDDARAQARAALASAPVADLRPHLEWALRRIRTSLDTGDKYGAAQAALDAAKAAPVASAPVAEPDTMGEIHRQERERSPWVLPKDPTLPDSAPVAGEAQGWSGWACQYPNKLPRLYGSKEIAQLNCDAANGDRVLFLSEHAAPQASAEDVRNSALEEAAALVGGHTWAGASKIVSDLIAEHIRALKTQADKDGGQQRAGDGSTSTGTWPTLSELHLHALMFAYNEGYSKAYDGRLFPNPFSENGSQAAAWQLGTDDGTEARAALSATQAGQGDTREA